MRKILFILMIALSILISARVSASRTEFDTNQTCDIEGKIQTVKFEEGFRDPCLDKGQSSCPVGAYNPDVPANYKIKILLSAVSCKPNEFSNQNSYEYQFPVNSEVEVYINKDKILTGDTFEAGKQIKGNVKYFFGHMLTSYVLEKTSNNNEIKLNQNKSKSTYYLFISFIIIISLIMTGLLFKKHLKNKK